MLQKQTAKPAAKRELRMNPALAILAKLGAIRAPRQWFKQATVINNPTGARGLKRARQYESRYGSNGGFKSHRHGR